MQSYYKTKNDVMTSSLEDKIDTLLCVNAKACFQSLTRFIKNKDNDINDIKERNIKIGALVEGEAYYHEKDQYYDVIGFLVESECEYHGNRLKTVGFRSIYFGKCDDYAPVDFDDGYSMNDLEIGNGLGDHVEITDVLVDENKVNEIIKEKNIDINKYLKEYGLLLPEKNIKNEKEKGGMIYE